MVEARRDTQAGAEIQEEYVRTNPNVQSQNMREFASRYTTWSIFGFVRYV